MENGPGKTLVVLTGPAGVGKQRLIVEVERAYPPDAVPFGRVTICREVFPGDGEYGNTHAFGERILDRNAMLALEGAICARSDGRMVAVELQEILRIFAVYAVAVCVTPAALAQAIKNHVRDNPSINWKLRVVVAFPITEQQIKSYARAGLHNELRLVINAMMLARLYERAFSEDRILDSAELVGLVNRAERAYDALADAVELRTDLIAIPDGPGHWSWKTKPLCGPALLAVAAFRRIIEECLSVRSGSSRQAQEADAAG